MSSPSRHHHSEQWVTRCYRTNACEIRTAGPHLPRIHLEVHPPLYTLIHPHTYSHTLKINLDTLSDTSCQPPLTSTTFLSPFSFSPALLNTPVGVALSFVLTSALLAYDSISMVLPGVTIPTPSALTVVAHTPMYWGYVTWNAPTYTLTVNVSQTIPIQQVNNIPSIFLYTLPPSDIPFYTPSYTPTHPLIHPLIHPVIHPLSYLLTLTTISSTPHPPFFFMPICFRHTTNHTQNVTLMINGSDITLPIEGFPPASAGAYTPLLCTLLVRALQSTIALSRSLILTLFLILLLSFSFIILLLALSPTFDYLAYILS